MLPQKLLIRTFDQTCLYSHSRNEPVEVLVLEFRVHTFVQAIILPRRSTGHMCLDMVVKHQMCREDRC